MESWSLGVNLGLYDALLQGRKTVDTRAPFPANPQKDYSRIREGDVLIFHAVDNNYNRMPELKYMVSYATAYPSIEKMLEKESLNDIFPDVGSVEKAVKIWHSFPAYRERIKRYGIIAIGLGQRLA